MAAYTRTTVIDSAPAGDTVKEAVLDLDTDLTGIVAAYNAHDPATTAVHGVGAGTVCGTTLTQTLTNKTVSSPTLTGTVAASGATISNPTITAGTIQGASTLNALTFAAATTGWTGAGGTASKTLTLTADTSLDEAVAMSSKAALTAIISGTGARSYLRSVNLRISDGTNADTIKPLVIMSGNYGWNGEEIAEADNLGKGGSSGAYILSASGGVLTIDFVKTVVGIISTSVVYMGSTTINPIYLIAYSSAGNLVINFSISGGSVADLTTITASTEIDVIIAYVTSD